MWCFVVLLGLSHFKTSSSIKWEKPMWGNNFKRGLKTVNKNWLQDDKYDWRPVLGEWITSFKIFVPDFIRAFVCKICEYIFAFSGKALIWAYGYQCPPPLNVPDTTETGWKQRIEGWLIIKQNRAGEGVTLFFSLRGVFSVRTDWVGNRVTGIKENPEAASWVFLFFRYLQAHSLYSLSFFLQCVCEQVSEREISRYDRTR